ncbi:S-adenosylmethionine:tRNA ribosyltransferase-isomerase [Candidatus Saccharibacteria bacterium]|nr:S-adenosylmethionine:tRNA ribosyltransferase-isomerase [Candidatus Saccharibacteria bacterium]
MLVSDYNYDLPEERIAKFPPEERGTTRLLVLDRKSGEVRDSYYRDLDEFLNPGDVLILNDTRVMQSRLFCELPDGRKRELVVLEKHGDEPQRVMYRGKLHDGDKLFIESRGAVRPARRHGRPAAYTSPCQAPDPLDSNEKFIEVTRILGNGIAEVESEAPLAELAEKYGTVPLPPYLHRDATEADRKRYQTVWAKNMGSAAAPTASLNMTDELLDRLRKKGVVIKYLTLHVGLGTFLPIRSDKIEEHKMHSEWFNIPADTIEAINNARRGSCPNPFFSGSAPKALAQVLDPSKKEFRSPAPKIIALGTTVARTLEFYAKTGKTSGEDDIFIYPGFEFQIVDALITNFHAPKSTVLMLASAFAGWDNLKNAYEHAIDEKYNFLSYGDSMLIC